MDVPIAPGDSFLQLLLPLVTFILHVGTNVALRILRLRMANTEVESRFQEELMQVDHVHDVLDRNDIRVLESRQESVATVRQRRRAFQTEYPKKVQEHKASEGPPRNRARNTASGSSTARPTQLPPIQEISQQDAKKYLPDGATTWQDRVRGGWHALYAPLPRVSRIFQRCGQVGALKECYRYVWEPSCTDKWVPLASCPMAGLFDSGEESARDPHGSAASSSGQR